MKSTNKKNTYTSSTQHELHKYRHHHQLQFVIGHKSFRPYVQSVCSNAPFCAYAVSKPKLTAPVKRMKEKTTKV